MRRNDDFERRLLFRNDEPQSRSLSDYLVGWFESDFSLRILSLLLKQRQSKKLNLKLLQVIEFLIYLIFCLRRFLNAENNMKKIKIAENENFKIWTIFVALHMGDREANNTILNHLNDCLEKTIFLISDGTI